MNPTIYFIVTSFLTSFLSLTSYAQAHAECNLDQQPTPSHQFENLSQVYEKIKNDLNQINSRKEFLQILQSLRDEQKKWNPLDPTYFFYRKKLNEKLIRNSGLWLNSPDKNETNHVKELMINDIKEIKSQKNNTTVLALGGEHSCLINLDNKVECWGDNTFGQLIPPPHLKEVQSVFAGSNHSCATTVEGKVTCWGFNDNQQASVPAHLPLVKSLALGSDFSCALTRENKVECWGNIDGWKVIGQNQVKSLQVGPNRACAIMKDHSINCWGDDPYQLHVPPADLGPVKSVSVGANHTCAINQEKEVICWGVNWYEQATPPKDLGKVKSISAGYSHTCAVTEDNQVRCWGYMGQVQSPAPYLELENVLEVKSGGSRSCALMKDNEVICWGGEGDGDNDSAITNPPTSISKIKKYD